MTSVKKQIKLGIFSAICSMLKLTHIFFILLMLGWTENNLKCQTILGPGDLAVIGLKTNSTTQAGNDAVKLVTLVNLECNTQFIITDNNWNGSAWACDNDEFGVQVTCNSYIPAGSVFYIDVDGAGNLVSCSGGAITRTDLGNPWGANFGLNSGGDNIYVLQGTRNAPIFIFAFKHSGSFSVSDCSNKNNANIPSGLTIGQSAITMPSGQNQWNYNCNTNNGNRATILTAICNTSNWTSNTVHTWNENSCVFNVTGQIISAFGVLAVAGSGCGCLSTCQLAYHGGINCGAGVAGDCSSGYQNISTLINVPGGCTYTVVAQMRARDYGCGSSGADGNCQTCDVLKVDAVSGSKIFQQGASNASLSDSYTLTGPGGIIVSGRANRADEIITYKVLVAPCECQQLILLPLDLTKFSGAQSGNSVEINWSISGEVNADYYTLERSADALKWETVLIAEGQPSSSWLINYKVYDTSPIDGITYYRLKQTMDNNKDNYSEIIGVTVKLNNKRKIIKRMTLLGTEADENYDGVLLLIYDNGDVEKTIRVIE